MFLSIPSPLFMSKAPCRLKNDGMIRMLYVVVSLLAITAVNSWVRPAGYFPFLGFGMVLGELGHRNMAFRVEKCLLDQRAQTTNRCFAQERVEEDEQCFCLLRSFAPTAVTTRHVLNG